MTSLLVLRPGWVGAKDGEGGLRFGVLVEMGTGMGTPPSIVVQAFDILSRHGQHCFALVILLMVHM